MPSQATRLREIALLFLRLGCTAFGGPAVHIAMMEEEVVRRRGWLTRQTFLDLLGATNLIPGPNSTEMAIHIGHQQAGWAGLIVAGLCFIVPASLITLVMAWAYVQFGSQPSATALLYAIKPVIIAVVLQALWGLARSAVKTRALAVLATASLLACIAGVNELIVLFGAGLIAAAVQVAGASSSTDRAPGVFGLAGLSPALVVGSTAAPFSLLALFLFFLKVGAILFGSGYVLLAFLHADLVDHWHWLSDSQLLDAVAIGQATPGPVFTTATFIGYLLGGGTGALVATVGIFLPSFVFVALSGPLIPRLRNSPTAGAFLDGVNVGSLVLMAVVTFALARSALIDITTVLLAITSAAAFLWYRVNSLLLIGAGALVGLLRYWVGS
ncbi:MAG TPA: chromate efflux transporter [Candidatus Acidoferrales bacterium]|nr:chromate efflux transporter [Candidatus Acidoferrales bacterium]